MSDRRGALAIALLGFCLPAIAQAPRPMTVIDCEKDSDSMRKIKTQAHISGCANLQEAFVALEAGDPADAKSRKQREAIESIRMAAQWFGCPIIE